MGTRAAAVDLFRLEDGKLAKQWDVLQYEALAAAGRIAMFDPREIENRS